MQLRLRRSRRRTCAPVPHGPNSLAVAPADEPTRYVATSIDQLVRGNAISAALEAWRPIAKQNGDIADVDVAVAMVDAVLAELHPDVAEHVSTEELLRAAIRQEHDLAHFDPWAICTVQVCRIAQQAQAHARREQPREDGGRPDWGTGENPARTSRVPS